MPRDTSNLEYINKAISGLTLEGIENIFRDPRFRDAFKKLAKSELKKVKIEADVSGLKDVKDLSRAFENATGASEEYFRSLGKYRSTIQAMNLAFKEGKTHMQEYLEQARNSGGKIAVAGAATLYLTKELTKQIEALRGAALASREYLIQQNLFSKTSNYSKMALDDFRRSLSLTKSDMKELYSTLSNFETLGFGLDQIENMFSKLKATYGPEGAMSLMKDYEKIMTGLPLLAQRGGRGATVSDVYSMKEMGVYDSYLQMKYSGEPTKEAELANHNKAVESYLESIKDSVLNTMPTALFDISKALNLILASMSTLIPLAVLTGNISGMMGTMGVGGAAAGGAMAGVPPASRRAWRAAGRGAAKAGKAAAGNLGAGLATVGKGVGAVASHAVPIGLLAAGFAEGGRQLAGRHFLGYAPSYKEMAGAVKEHGINFRDLFAWGGRWGGSKGEESTAQEISDTKSKIGMEALNKSYEQMRMFEDRWTHYFVALDGVNQTMADIALETGNSAKLQENISEYTARANQKYKEGVEFYQKELDKAESDKAWMIKNGVFDEDAQANYESNLVKARKGMAEAEQQSFSAFKYVLDKEKENILKQGGYGYERQLEIRGRAAMADYGVEYARIHGGDHAALKERRDANLEEARSNVKAAENLKEKLLSDREKAKTDEQRLIIEERLIKANEEHARAMQSLNNAMRDTRHIDNLAERLESMHGVFESLSRLVSATDGSFESMLPYMEKNLEYSKKQEDLARQRYDTLLDSGMAEDSTDVVKARNEWLNAQIKVAEETYNYARQERDLRLSEIELQSGWQKEQADFYSEMGAHFGDVLSLRSQAVQTERESISVLEDYLASGVLSGKERMTAEIELERKKMKLTRDTIGIQKDAYERFVGMAFGQLNDVGFKRGRMDDAVLMGVAATRVKNRAGLYESGGATGFNRDEMSALMATGSANTHAQNFGGYTNQDMVRGEAAARRVAGIAASEAQRVDVTANIKVEPSREFNATVEETVVNVLKTMGSSWGRTN